MEAYNNHKSSANNSGLLLFNSYTYINPCFYLFCQVAWSLFSYGRFILLLSASTLNPSDSALLHPGILSVSGYLCPVSSCPTISQSLFFINNENNAYSQCIEGSFHSRIYPCLCSFCIASINPTK